MIAVESRGDVLVVRIDRPERRNALDVPHCDDLRAAVEGADARAIVVTGAGTTFCAGADFDALYEGGFRAALYAMLRSIVDFPAPVLAAVNGPAIGAGTQLALACDLRIAAPGAVFSVPTARIGIAVDPWTIRRLAELAGGGVARALLLGCDDLRAEDAPGLVNRIGDLDAALAWAEEVAALAPLSVAYAKRVLNGADDGFDAVWASEDAAEGRRARAERRPPRFRGR